ncbi:HisA/HisF-related TIM barrel protein [Pirellulaceae bacterium]|nr:HisA/HisF-related TIM barrel protein [Mariniblastus sp.]MDB4755849.1 HisA/HisF-related TIM barrel protein [Mariniblastus sp.]MDB4793945.1 HisA/HisF-related TIM barrel protein [Pirellulaceae bacterium]
MEIVPVIDLKTCDLNSRPEISGEGPHSPAGMPAHFGDSRTPNAVSADVPLCGPQVVHAIAGKREDYRPIKHSRFDTRSTRVLCSDLIQEFHPKYFYLADLDAITGSGNALNQIHSLLDLPTHFLIDYGIRDIHGWRQLYSRLKNHDRWSAILASETIESLDLIDEISNDIPPDQLFFSIDFNKGRLTTSPALGEIDFFSLIKELKSRGVRQLILLEVSSVGTATSPVEQIIASYDQINSIFQSASPRDPLFKVFAGGGLNCWQDLQRCRNSGMDGVLLATALHNGKIRREHLEGL